MIIESRKRVVREPHKSRLTSHKSQRQSRHLHIVRTRDAHDVKHADSFAGLVHFVEVKHARGGGHPHEVGMIHFQCATIAQANYERSEGHLAELFADFFKHERILISEAPPARHLS